MNVTIKAILPFIHDYSQHLEVVVRERQQSLKFKLTGKWGVLATELELLVGRQLEAVYYKIGERTSTGKLITERNMFYNIKGWNLLPQSSSHLNNPTLNFLTIREISVLRTYRGLLHIYTQEEKESYLYSSHKLSGETGLPENEFSLLKGAKISPVCYKDGDISEMYEWPVYSKPGYNETIVRDLNLRLLKPLK